MNYRLNLTSILFTLERKPGMETTAMTKPGRESPQYVYSERDVKYLELQGWTKVPKPEPPKERKTLRLKDKQ